RPTTYGELRRQVAALRTGLVEQVGVRPGDRVALLCANNWFFAVSHLAALGAGALVVPLNPASAPAELERELADTEASVVVVAPAGRAAFAGVDGSALPVEHVLVPEGVLLDGAEPMEALFADTRKPAAVVERDPDDL